MTRWTRNDKSNELPWLNVRWTRRGRRETPIRFPARIAQIEDRQIMARDPIVRDRYPAPVCTMACYRGECIGLNETLGKPIQRENRVTTVNQPLDVKWTRYNLETIKTKSRIFNFEFNLSFINWMNFKSRLPWRKLEMSCSWGMLSSA